MAAAARPPAPTCEDYESSSDEEVLPGFRRSPAPGQANVAAKRSHTSDNGTEKPAERRGLDVASDSGYSSHTAATMSSADSAPSAKSQSPPHATAAPIPPPSPAVKRRPTLDRRERSGQDSPRKPLQRSGSVSSRRPARERRETLECTDPNCTKCPPSSQAARGRRPQPSPLDSGLDISYPQSQQSDPAPYTPRSPTFTRQPAYIQGSAIVQPAVSAGSRRRSSSQSRARPLSYHGEPQSGYWVPGMSYPTPPQERGPPPSMSAHFNMYPPQAPQMAPYAIMGATPPNHFYPPGHPLTTSPPYDQQRPQLQSRTSSQYSTRRPNSQYGPPLITQDQGSQMSGSMPSARYPTQPQSARNEKFPSSSFDNSSSEEESEGDTDRAIMPPPQRRPSLKQRKTTQVVYPLDRRMSMSQSQTLPERPRERDPRASVVRTAASSRTPSSARRPSLYQEPKAKSYEQAGRPQVLVESARSRRRQSYMGYEQEAELERKLRNTKLYYNDTPAPSSQQSRRQTDADARRRDENESKLRQAEAHQQRTRGTNVPLTEQALKTARRTSRVVSGASDTASSHSKGSDKQSRVSQSNRTTVTNSNNGEIRLRVDASAPLSLQFNGDMEGRTIALNPVEGGMADIVIGAARESVYRSEKGSVASSRKALMARREAEEESVRSRRSSRSGRDGERRVLRRRQQYYED